MKVFIQAVEERKIYVDDYIIPKLKEHPIFDEIEVFYDIERMGCVWSMGEIYKLVIKRGEPCLVLQDDVIIHKLLGDGISQLMKHLTRFPAISLYANRRSLYANKKKAGYNSIINYVHLGNCGLIVTPSFCDQIIKFIPKAKQMIHDDGIIAEYQAYAQLAILTCLPSLIQHNIGMPSTLGHINIKHGIIRHSPVWDDTISRDQWTVLVPYILGGTAIPMGLHRQLEKRIKREIRKNKRANK